MTSTTARVTIVQIHDQEGDGRCSACDREGLRWVAELSDGTMVGLECAKRVLGYKPAPKSYNWVADFTAVTRHQDGDQVHVLYRHKTRATTAWTQDGVLMAMGGAAETWARYGWPTD